MDKKKEYIVDAVQRRLAQERTVNPSDIAQMIRQEAGVISDEELLTLLHTIRFDSDGIGPLEYLTHIEDISDIVVNGAKEVWYCAGQGMRRAEYSFESENHVRTLAQRLAARCGVRLDDAHPWADGRIYRADGSIIRFHAILSPPSDKGVCMSLRFLRHAHRSLQELGIETQAQEILSNYIKQKKSILVIGGTGSGKTTLLSALLHEVSHEERIICLEDTAELNPKHPHVIHLISRGANIEGEGAITISQLLKQALRMRPDRIIVGEIRGAEVIDLLSALNTGHEGGGGTVHANSIDELPARMEALAALGGMDAHALHSQLSAAVDVVVSMKKRKVNAIGLIEGNPVKVRVIWSTKEQK